MGAGRTGALMCVVNVCGDVVEVIISGGLSDQPRRCLRLLYYFTSRPLSVFHPANASSDGWDTPQTPQSPVPNSCATDPDPTAPVPKSQVIKWG